MSAGDISAVILSAGYSSRMGAFKPLIPIQGETLLERNIRLFQSVGIRNIIVVTGHHHTKVEPVVSRCDGRSVFNENYASGMFGSIQCGVKNVNPESTGFFLLPVDIPSVRPRTISALITAFKKDGAWIYHPTFLGKTGHPPLFSKKMAPPISAWDDPAGLHPLLLQYADRAWEVPVIDEGILLDANHPQDIQYLTERAARAPYLSHNEYRALMHHCSVPRDTQAHCLKVAQIAGILGAALNRHGSRLNLPLIDAGARVHDLAKGQKNHANMGARILKTWGLDPLADIVARHIELGPLPEGSISEAAVVYLADKLINGTNQVTIQERFAPKITLYQNNAPAKKAVKARMETAQALQKRIEKQVGMSIDHLITTADTSASL